MLLDPLAPLDLREMTTEVKAAYEVPTMIVKELDDEPAPRQHSLVAASWYGLSSRRSSNFSAWDNEYDLDGDDNSTTSGEDNSKRVRFAFNPVASTHTYPAQTNKSLWWTAPELNYIQQRDALFAMDHVQGCSPSYLRVLQLWDQSSCRISGCDAPSRPSIADTDDATTELVGLETQCLEHQLTLLRYEARSGVLTAQDRLLSTDLTPDARAKALSVTARTHGRRSLRLARALALHLASAVMDDTKSI